MNQLIIKFSFIIVSFLSATDLFAQDAGTTPKNPSSNDNMLVILMGIIALVLAFVIWGMGQVLITIGKQALEKSRKNEKLLGAIFLLGFSMISQSISAQTASAAEKTTATANYGGLDSTAFWLLVLVLFIELVLIAFLMFSIRRIQHELLPVKAKTGPMALAAWWTSLDKKLFTKAVAVEKEADILMDHDYDGIKELDNALPPWWKYGFIITIGVAFVYLLNFHVFGYGQNPTEEYQEEMARAKEAKELFESKNVNKIDENNLKMPESAGINAGKEIFQSICWTCHGKLGEGGAGPNLTDDYWLHKGSLSDLYQSIKNGYPDKGMQAWEKNYSPKEILDLAGYVKTLKGTHPPNPKAPQGDLFIESVTSDTTTASKIQPGTKVLKADSISAGNK